jgi:hypothetical protein
MATAKNLIALGMNKHQARALAGAATPFTATNAQNAPAGGAGIAAGGWSSAVDRDTAITTINQLRADLNALILELKNQGTLS